MKKIIILLSLLFVLCQSGQYNKMRAYKCLTLDGSNRCGGRRSPYNKNHSGLDRAIKEERTSHRDDGGKYLYCNCYQNRWRTVAIDVELNYVVTDVWTIWTAHTTDYEADYVMKLCDSDDCYNNNGWTTVCDPCYAGSNDVYDYVNGVGRSFKWIRLESPVNKKISFCGVWAYGMPNLMLQSALSYHVYAIQQTDSIDPQHFVTSPVSVHSQGKSFSDYMRDSGGISPTCVYREPGSPDLGQFSYFVIDLPYHILLREIITSTYYWNKAPHWFALVDMVDMTVSTQTADEMADVLIANGELEIDNYPNRLIKVVKGLDWMDEVAWECDSKECEEWATKRVIIKSQQKKLFHVCGMAIFGERLPCPPTRKQCQHIYINPPTETIANMLIQLGQTADSVPFSFRDSMTDQCAEDGAEGCSQYKTYNMFCNPCADIECLPPADISGYTVDGNQYVTYNYQADGFTVVMTATSPSDNTRTLDHRCIIRGEIDGNGRYQYSNSFLFQEPCLSCEDSEIMISATLPPETHFSLIPIGATGRSFTFQAFSQTAGLCTMAGFGTCEPVDHTIQCCLEKNANGDTFDCGSGGEWVDPEQDLGWIPQINMGSGTDIQLSIASTNKALHDHFYTCRIVGELLQSTKDPGRMLYSPEFDVSFSICVDPAESCSFNVWESPPDSWVEPQDLNVFVDADPVSTSFLYSDWKDSITSICGKPVCGKIKWYLIAYYSNTGDDVDFTNSTIHDQSMTHYDVTDDTNAEQVTLQFSTTNQTLSGKFRVRIEGRLQCQDDPPKLKTLEKDCLGVTWTSFKLNILNVCDEDEPCLYTNVLLSPTALTQQLMTAYVDNVMVKQEFTPFQDKVTNLQCKVNAGDPDEYNLVCETILYSVVHATTLETLPDSLVWVDDGLSPPQVRVQTSEYTYCGITPVKIKAEMVYRGSSISYFYGNEFDIQIDCCNSKSCMFTQIVQLSNSDKIPYDYRIGVDNVQESIQITKNTNTCAVGCGTNDLICGTPTFTLEMQDFSPIPTFMTFDNAAGASEMTHSAQTFDLADEGFYTLRILVYLDKSGFGNAQMTPEDHQIYTQSWTVEVNVCDPLPCNYNKVLKLDSQQMKPSDLFYMTDSVPVSTKFDAYKDQVSVRCYKQMGYSSYRDLCGTKTYVIEKADGSNMPPEANLQITNNNDNTYTISGWSNNNLVYGQFLPHIHVGLASSTDQVADDTSIVFSVTIQRSPMCDWVEPSLSALVPVTDGTKYTLPSDFSIYATDEWGYTYFDNWNDTFTENCLDKNGFYWDGVGAESWTAAEFKKNPVLSIIGQEYNVHPIYTVVSAEDLTPFVPAVFENGDVVVEYHNSTEYGFLFRVKARTTRLSLVGEHEVKIQVQKTQDSIPAYTNSFTITVIDQCRPIPCPSVIYYQDDDVKPDDVEVVVYAGYVTHTSSFWTSNFAQWCSDSGVFSQCYQLQFELVQMDCECPPIDFAYIIRHSAQGLKLYISANNEEIRGNKYNVYIRATSVSGGKGGQTKPFKIIISDEIIEQINMNTDRPPRFEEFPASILYKKYTDKVNIPESYRVGAVCIDDEGEVQAVNVLGENDFIGAQIDGTAVSFLISLDEDTPVGKSTITIQCVDEQGQMSENSFTVEVKLIMPPKVEVQVVEVEEVDEEEQEEDPVEVQITSISITGLMKIEYSKQVIPVNQTFDWSNKTEFSISLEQRSSEKDQTDLFNYEVLNMTSRMIYVQLLFAVPLEISQGVKPDIIQLKMLRSSFMVEPGKEIPISTGSPETDYVVLDKLIPKQVDSEEELQILIQNSATFSNMAQVFFWAPLAIHIGGIGSMDMTWVLFRQLQIFEVLSQFDLKLPANVIMLTQSYSNTANQQIIPPEGSYVDMKQMFTFRKPEEEVGDLGPKMVWECDEVGDNCLHKEVEKLTNQGRLLSEEKVQINEFEQSRFANRGSKDMVLIPFMQSLILLTFLIGLGLTGIIIKYTCLFWTPQLFKSFFTYIQNRVFWNLPLRVMLQQYVIVSMSVFLNYRFRDNVEPEDKSNRVVAGLLMFFYVLVFPAAVIYFLFKYNYLWVQKNFAAKFDSICLELYVQSNWAAIMYGLSMVRCFLFIYLAVQLDFSLAQFTLSLYVQQFYTMYVLQHKPPILPWRDSIEFFNEIVIFSLILLMCTLTDYVPSPNVRYNVTGWMMIYIIYFQFSVNAFFITYQQFGSLRIFYYKSRQRYYQYKASKLPRNHVQNREDVLSDVSSFLRQFEKKEKVKKSKQKGVKKGQVEQKKTTAYGLDPITEDDNSQEGESQINYRRELSERKKRFLKILEEAQPIAKGGDNGDKTMMHDNTIKLAEEEAEWIVTARQKVKKEDAEIDIWGANPNNYEENRDDWNALPRDYEANIFDQSINLSASEYNEKSAAPKQSERQSSLKESQLITQRGQSIDEEINIDTEVQKAAKSARTQSINSPLNNTNSSFKLYPNSIKKQPQDNNKSMRDSISFFSDQPKPQLPTKKLSVSQESSIDYEFDH